MVSKVWRFLLASVELDDVQINGIFKSDQCKNFLTEKNGSVFTFFEEKNGDKFYTHSTHQKQFYYVRSTISIDYFIRAIFP